jgi:hypothetical protein
VRIAMATCPEDQSCRSGGVVDLRQTPAAEDMGSGLLDREVDSVR